MTVREATDTPLLVVDRLSVAIRDRRGRTARVVDEVSFEVKAGQIVGIIGESGSGKTMTALAVLGLLPSGATIVSGDIRLEGRSLIGLDERELRSLRGSRMALIPQDSLSALNPTMAVDRQVGEPLVIHRRVTWSEARARALTMLKRVHLPEAESRARGLPHQMSGGMAQRAMTAMSLTLDPPLLIADEPTTALDVTIQAQVLRLLGEIRDANGLGIVLITHDLGVVAEICDSVVVMYAGRIVEQGTVQRVLQQPAHPYTQALMAATPRLDSDAEELIPIRGQPPSPMDLPTGCRFADRCPSRFDRCDEEPDLIERATGQFARCWLA